MSTLAAHDFLQVWLRAMSAHYITVALLTLACCFVCAAAVPMCSSLLWHSCCSSSSSCGACCVLSSRPLLTHHGLQHQEQHQAEVACLSACMRVAWNCPACNPATTSQHSCTNRSHLVCTGVSCAGAAWSAAAVAAVT